MAKQVVADRHHGYLLRGYMQLISLIPPPVTIAVCLGALSTISANILSFIMIGKINERVPVNDRVSYFWWGTEVRKKFKQLYPGNKLVLLLDSCFALMLICSLLLIKFWVFG